MSDDFYPFVDSGDPAPNNNHITGSTPMEQNGETRRTSSGNTGAENTSQHADGLQGVAARHRSTQESLPAQAPVASQDEQAVCAYACRIAVYDDMLSTPRVIVIAPGDVRTYLEEITNTVYSCMKEQGGGISLMVIREIVENFIHAHFVEPIISILDDGNTIRFADQGPGIEDKERAFEFGVTSAGREQKRYIRGTGAGFPMVQQYLENAGGAISIEDNLHQGTVVTVSIDPQRVTQIEAAQSRGGAVRGGNDTGAVAANPWGYADGAQQAQQPYQPYPPQATPAAFTVGNGMPGAGAWGGFAPGANAPQAGAAAAWGWPAPGAWQNAAAPGWPSGYAPYPVPQPQGAGLPAQGMAAAYAEQGAAYGSAGYPVPGGAGQPARTFVSERGTMALQYLAQHGSCGPTDLSHAYGVSTPTWSRELDALAQAGLVIKRGQKRYLTDAGRIHIAQSTAGNAGEAAIQTPPASPYVPQGAPVPGWPIGQDMINSQSPQQ